MKPASADKLVKNRRRAGGRLMAAAAILMLCAAAPGCFAACSAVQASVGAGESVPTGDAAGVKARSGVIPPCDPSAFEYGTESDAIIDGADLLPGLIRDQIFLKRFIRDPRFLKLRTLCGDTAAADAIFLRALEIADGDLGHALLVAMFGTMDHYRLSMRLPLVGVLTLPLTSESDSTFSLRHRHLPRRVLPDSIGRTASDKDKLQHFFGSAYLAYFTHSNALALFMGNFIETGEAAIVVGGANDARDKFANMLGREFGFRLLEGEELVPSDILWRKNQ